MDISNTQILFLIFIFIFVFIFIFKQEDKNILKPNEDKSFPRFKKRDISLFLLIFICFSLAYGQNYFSSKNDRKETVELIEEQE